MAITDIYDIKPPVPLEQGPGWTMLFLVGIGLVLLGLAAWRVRPLVPGWRRRWSLARALSRLEAEAPELNVRDFSFRLAELLRRALANRTGLDTLAMTTEEIVPRLGETALPEDVRTAVAASLDRADLGRYADPGQICAATRQTDLATTRAVLGRGRLPWFP